MRAPIRRNHAFWRPSTPREAAQFEADCADGNRERDCCGHEAFAHALASSINPKRKGRILLICPPDEP